MGLVNHVTGVVHRIRVFLYPCRFPLGTNGFYAKTDSESTLGIEEVCANLKTRGGYPGRYEDAVECVRQFLDEMVYALADGYRINLKFFSVYPNIGGIFKTLDEPFDPKKHPVTFRYQTLKPLLKMREHIAVDIAGLYNSKAFISSFADREQELEPNHFLPGDMFCITGNKIMLEGDDPECGVFFVPDDDPSAAVKVDRIGENAPQMITGIAPNTFHQRNRIEIRTRHSGTGAMLKNRRVIQSGFTVEAA